MFAPRTVKPQASLAIRPTDESALRRALTYRHDLDIEREQTNQRAPQTGVGFLDNELAAWSFSEIPLNPSGQKSGSERPSPGLPRLPIQAKLEVGAVDDPLEHEAERVADEVMRMPATEVTLTSAPKKISRKCTACEEQEKPQRKESGPQAAAGEVPAIVHEVLRSRGQPLDVATRAFMEPRIGHDFSHVRIHSDVQAAQSARQLHARAYTVGDHIVFAEGPRGRRLLAHELTHVVQQGVQGAILRRQPNPQVDEARLRVNIVETLKATKERAVDALISAIDRGDRAYLQVLGLSSKEVDHLLNRTPKLYEMMFGKGAELAVEQAVRADPLLSQYVHRVPQGRVPRGVGKPDWSIETPSSSIPVDLMTPDQIEKKLEMWRRQWKRGKPKWYVEKGLNITYDRPPPPPARPPGTTPEAPPSPTQISPAATPEIAPVPPAAAREIAPVVRTSGLRTAGRFFAREIPNLALQLVVMLLFPPGVVIRNDKAKELNSTKLDPAIQDALAKQDAKIAELLDVENAPSIYANVTANLDFSVYATPSSPSDLVLTLQDASVLDVEVSYDDITVTGPKDSKFVETGSLKVTKKVTYSMVLYEPLWVTRERAQKAYEACVKEHGTGFIPPAAGVEAAEAALPNPEEGPCIPPH